MVAGKNCDISVKRGRGKPKRAMIKVPLVVLGRICTKSAGVVRLESSSKRSSEMTSVKVPDGPMGISARAV